LQQIHDDCFEALDLIPLCEQLAMNDGFSTPLSIQTGWKNTYAKGWNNDDRSLNDGIEFSVLILYQEFNYCLI
jgi:hypothetical protein